MGIGCSPNNAECLKIYSDLASIEAFIPVLSAVMGVLLKIRRVNDSSNKQKKNREAGIMSGVFLCGK